jgi:hypothetical protein
MLSVLTRGGWAGFESTRKTLVRDAHWEVAPVDTLDGGRAEVDGERKTLMRCSRMAPTEAGRPE